MFHSSIYRWFDFLQGAGLGADDDVPLFTKVDKMGAIDKMQQVQYNTFAADFKRDIAAALPNENPHIFGTHSFRRGGCQYYHCFMNPKNERWDLKKLCDWGGWSLGFDNLIIVRYLTNYLDKEACPREQYLQLKRKPKQMVVRVETKCPSCQTLISTEVNSSGSP